jgi:hypothetical protein
MVPQFMYNNTIDVMNSFFFLLKGSGCDVLYVMLFRSCADGFHPMLDCNAATDCAIICLLWQQAVVHHYKGRIVRMIDLKRFVCIRTRTLHSACIRCSTV